MKPEPDITMPCVTVGGVEIEAAAIAAEMQHHPSSDPETAWTAAAEALVIRQLLLDEAANLAITPEAMSDEAGNTLVPDDAVIETLLEQEVKTPRADETVCRRFFDQNKERFCSTVLVEAAHILFAASPDDAFAMGLATGDARAAIKTLQAEPEKFAELAQLRSACPSGKNGGNLGQVGPGQMVKPFEQALFALEQGALCDQPVKSRFGVHVIRAGNRVEGEELPFDAVKQAIAGHLEEASWRKAIAQYIAILASKTKIEGVVLAGADGPLVQ